MLPRRLDGGSGTVDQGEMDNKIILSGTVYTQSLQWLPRTGRRPKEQLGFFLATRYEGTKKEESSVTVGLSTRKAQGVRFWVDAQPIYQLPFSKSNK